MPNIFGDKELAKTIELVAAQDDALYVDAMKKLQPDKDWENFEFEGGVSCFVGASPFSGTHGFGLGDVNSSEQILNMIEEFFKNKDYSPSLSVASVVDSSSLKLLSQRGYGIFGCRNVYLYEPSFKCPNKSYDSIKIKEVSTQDD